MKAFTHLVEKFSLALNFNVKKILIVLIDRPHKNLGGQERRWLRLANHLVLKNYGQYGAITNNATLALAKNTEIEFKSNVILVPDFHNRLADNFIKNLLLIVFSWGYRKIYISNQSAFLLPASLVLKFIFKKEIYFSYNGTSLTIHKNWKPHNYFNIIRIMHFISHKTEILNPRLLDEGWINEGKTLIAPCSFSDANVYYPSKKIKSLAFAGHFYKNKGIDLLRKIISSSEGRGYTIMVYGDSIEGYPESEIFKGWIAAECKRRPYLHSLHLNDMSHAFSSISVFLSLQQTSNYPSQSVIEALYSGCSVLMTDTGDSREFGENSWIDFITDLDTENQIWEKIEKLSEYSDVNFNHISLISKRKYCIEGYIKSLEGFFGIKTHGC